MNDTQERPEMTPPFEEPLTYEEAISKYPVQMEEIRAEIARTTLPMGKYRKPINTFNYPDDFKFYTMTMRMWTSIRKDGMDELKSMVVGMKKYDVVFDRKIEKRNLYQIPKKPSTEDVLGSLLDDMTMLDGAGVDNDGQPLIKLADALKAMISTIFDQNIHSIEDAKKFARPIEEWSPEEVREVLRNMGIKDDEPEENRNVSRQ